MGRHRHASPSKQQADAYPEAGKRRRTTERTVQGRHRAAPNPPGSVPGSCPTLVGAAVVVGVLGGSAAIAAQGEVGAVGSSAASAPSVETTPRVQPGLIERRELGVSRSSSRSALTPADAVDQAARQRARALRKQEAAAREHAREVEVRQWVLPVANYHLTGTFGEASSLWSSTHTGLDFATSYGTDIHAVAGGTITETGWAGSYGYRTIETLPDGTEIWYAHQSKILVNVGDRVGRNDVIGEVGSTGNSTGSHVHLEVRPHGGDPIDPQIALPEHGVTP